MNAFSSPNPPFQAQCKLSATSGYREKYQEGIATKYQSPPFSSLGNGTYVPAAWPRLLSRGGIAADSCSSETCGSKFKRMLSVSWSRFSSASVYPFSGPLRSCSGQLHGRLFSRHCSQTGLRPLHFCFLERHELQAVVIRAGLFSFDFDAILFSSCGRSRGMRGVGYTQR